MPSLSDCRVNLWTAQITSVLQQGIDLDTEALIADQWRRARNRSHQGPGRRKVREPLLVTYIEVAIFLDVHAIRSSEFARPLPSSPHGKEKTVIRRPHCNAAVTRFDNEDALPVCGNTYIGHPREQRIRADLVVGLAYPMCRQRKSISVPVKTIAADQAEKYRRSRYLP